MAGTFQLTWSSIMRLSTKTLYHFTLSSPDFWRKWQDWKNWQRYTSINEGLIYKAAHRTCSAGSVKCWIENGQLISTFVCVSLLLWVAKSPALLFRSALILASTPKDIHLSIHIKNSLSSTGTAGIFPREDLFISHLWNALISPQAPCVSFGIEALSLCCPKIVHEGFGFMIARKKPKITSNGPIIPRLADTPDGLYSFPSLEFYKSS